MATETPTGTPAEVPSETAPGTAPGTTPRRVDRALLASWPLPSGDGDKSDRGTLLVVGGARQSPGAVLLAAESALRAGAGKVQVATAADVATALAVAAPELYVEGLPVLRSGELALAGADRVLEMAAEVDAVLLGPGIGDPECANLFLSQVVPHLDTDLVIDALGTAYLTEHPDGVSHLAERCLLTPNVTETAAMLHLAEAEVERDPLAAATQAARRTGATVLSGGATSYVVDPDGTCWSIEGGAPGLATAGSGDVKAGVVAGLVARGAAPDQAAVWGQWAHAAAGTRLSREAPGFLARQLAGAVPRELAGVAS